MKIESDLTIQYFLYQRNLQCEIKSMVYMVPAKCAGDTLRESEFGKQWSLKTVYHLCSYEVIP